MKNFEALYSTSYCLHLFQASIEDTMGVLWTIFQPLLFGLIGAEVIIEYLDANLVGKNFGKDF